MQRQKRPTQRPTQTFYRPKSKVPLYRSVQVKTPSDPYDVKPLCGVVPGEELSNTPIKIILPASIQSLMQHINQQGFHIFIKGGRPRRLIRLQQVATLIETKKERFNQISVSEKASLQKELDLHQEELNILQQELEKCDWDLVTNAPRGCIEEYLGRAANKHHQDLFLRYHHVGDENYDVDILYSKPFKVLTDLIETTDFCSRAIYIDVEGHVYDITGKGVSDIWNAELHSPFLPHALFNQYSISLFSLIETLVKYHYENPALDLDQSIENGMCGFFQADDSLSNYFNFLKKEDAGQYGGRLTSLLNLKYLDISLKVLCKTGLLGYLFPDISMDLQDEKNDAWLHAALTDRLKALNQQAGYQAHNLFEVFISASLSISAADISMDEKGNKKPHNDASLKERVAALIKDNMILNICYKSRDTLIIPYYQRIFELALTRYTFALPSNDEATMLFEGLKEWVHFFIQSASIQSIAELNTLSDLDGHLYSQEKLRMLCAKKTAFFCHINPTDEVQIAYNAMIDETMAFCRAGRVQPPLYKAKKLTKIKFSQEETDWEKRQTEDERKQCVLNYLHAAYLDLSVHKLNFASKLLSEAAYGIEPINVSSAVLVFETRAQLCTHLSNPLEAARTWNHVASQLEAYCAQDPFDKRDAMVRQLMAWRQLLRSINEFQVIYQANPNYFVEQESAKNRTIPENVKRMQNYADSFDVLGPLVNLNIIRLEWELVILPALDRQPAQTVQPVQEAVSPEQSAQPEQVTQSLQPVEQAKSSRFFKNELDNRSSNRTASRGYRRGRGGK